MAYSLHEDNLGRDPRWAVLARLGEPDGPDPLEMSPAKRRAVMARRERRRRDLILSHYLMTLETSAHKDDGYITLEAALACCSGAAWQVKALAMPACGRPPFLHSKGDLCAAKNCIDSSPPWKDGYEYRLCAFLKRNPSKAEQDRRRAQNDDARDPRLRAILMERDGPFCRYCRSGPLSTKAVRADERRKVLQRDHPDPDRPAGPNAENWVTACGSCNEHKARRTPFEADMVLLDPPTEQEKAEWSTRGLMLFPPPWISNRITDGSTSDHRQNTDPDVDPNGDPDVDPDTTYSAPVCPDPAAEQPEHRQNHRREGFGSGRVGQPSDGVLGALGQPVRDASSPDIYHRRSRGPEPRAGPP